MSDPERMAETPKPIKSGLVRLIPFVLILIGTAFALSQGWHQHLTPEALAANAAELDAAVQRNFLKIFIAYIAVYIAATVFMLPGSVTTIAGGFLFGLVFGVPAVVIGATVGGSILFLISKTSLGEFFRERAGPFLKKMQAGFEKDALAYLFSLRLIPAVPFAVANVGPALLGARFRDFVLSTAIGIIPATTAYVWLGAAAKNTLLEAANAGETLDAALLFKSLAANFVPALIALGAVSLIPIVYRRLSARKSASQS